MSRNRSASTPCEGGFRKATSASALGAAKGPEPAMPSPASGVKPTVATSLPDLVDAVCCQSSRRHSWLLRPRCGHRRLETSAPDVGPTRQPPVYGSESASWWEADTRARTQKSHSTDVHQSTVSRPRKYQPTRCRFRAPLTCLKCRLGVLQVASYSRSSGGSGRRCSVSEGNSPKHSR